MENLSQKILAFFKENKNHNPTEMSRACYIYSHIYHDNIKEIDRLLKTPTYTYTVEIINALIDVAIQYTQSGGSIEAQTILMRYKKEHFGFDNDDDVASRFEL